jgi:predicted nucleic acid-binding protein
MTAMNVFFDTNALLKLYFYEEGTVALNDFMRHHSGNITLAISELSLVEIRSALFRRVRMAECSLAIAKQICLSLDQDKASMLVCPLDITVLSKAQELLEEHSVTLNLRTLDSLQIASALVLGRTTQINAVLSSDSTFLKVMKQYVPALNPVTDVLF